MSKKKLIRVEKAESIKSIYDSKSVGSSGFSLGFIGKAEDIRDGIKYKKQISNFVTCRETFCSIPRQAANPELNTDNGNIASFDPKDDQLDFDNARLLLCMPENKAGFRDIIFSAKRIVNILEEEAGWDNKSIITTVKHTTYTDSENIFLFTGTKEWMSSPQMLSLLVLLLRIPFSTSTKYKSNTYKELQEELNSISLSQYNRDTEFLSEVRKKIVKVMRNVNKIFDDDIRKTWPKDPDKFIGYGGISTLFKCATGDEELNKRFKEIVLNK